MNANGKKHFSGRALASTLSGLSFLGMCVTGVILFIVPPGRIANWTGWTIFGLSKDQWQGLHIWLGIAFVVAVLVHLLYNWRPLLSYFKGQVSKSLAFRCEWALSLLICGVIAFGTVANIKPFSSLLTWHESIKHSWDQTERRAPVPHAELLTLTELAGYEDNLTVEAIVANLQGQGVAVESPEQVVGELAQAHNMTPDALYAIAIGQTHTGPGHGNRQEGGSHGQGGGGRGIGRMTLKDYCAGAGIEVDAAIEKLRQAGLKPTETMTLREIADTGNLHPSQIRTLLE